MYTPPPQARRPLDLLFSLHYLPLVTSLTVGCAGVLFHALSLRWTFLLAFPLAAVSVVTHVIEPILTFAPVGGHHSVRSLELPREADTSAPPLTLFHPTCSSASVKHVRFTDDPANMEDTAACSWLPFQDVRYVDGMARYAHLPAFLLRDMQLTRVRESTTDRRAPLLDAKGRPRPVLLFSHGIGGYPRLYSCLLMDLAARGAIVIAMTHQDGSAAFCRDVHDDFAVPIDTALDWEVETREKQMLVRVQETRATLDRFENGQLFRDVGYSEREIEEFLSASREHPAVTLVGHSFGAATVMATAMEESASADSDPRGARPSRVSGVVALDPWGQPLCGEYFHKAILAHKKTYKTPTLQFHSEAWVRWGVSWDFFRELEKDLTEKQNFTASEAATLAEAGRRTAAARLASNPTWYTLRTSPGTTHLSYCDLTQLSPVVYKKSYAKAPARAQIVEWATECLKFATTHNPLVAGSDEGAAPLNKADLEPSAVLQRQRDSVREITEPISA